MSNNTEGKVVITGVSGGLGEASARLLYAQGASVVLGRRLLYVLTKLNRKALHWLAPPTPYQQVLTAPLVGGVVKSIWYGEYRSKKRNKKLDRAVLASRKQSD